MRSFLAAVVSAFSLSSFGAPKVILYQGDARLVSLSDGSVQIEQVLLRKTLDDQTSTLTEIACFKDPGKPAVVSPVYMKVSGSSMQISDQTDFSQGKLSGTGTLEGPAWGWNVLRWEMKYQTPAGTVGVIDVNFIVGNRLIGRKQMFFNSQPFRLWEAELTEVSTSDFQAQAISLGCPVF